MIESRNDICRGELSLWQPAKGYRFNIDSVLLAWFAQQHISNVAKNVLEIGAGCGIVGMLVGKRNPTLLVTLVEIQEEFSRIIAKNIVENQLAANVSLLQGDIRDILKNPIPPMDLIVSNPPFFKKGEGCLSPNHHVATAKHELNGGLVEWIPLLKSTLTPTGKIVVIHNYKNLKEIVQAFQSSNLGEITFSEILSTPGKAPKRVLIAASIPGSPNKKGELRQGKSVIIKEESGEYTPLLKSMLNEED